MIRNTVLILCLVSFAGCIDNIIDGPDAGDPLADCVPTTMPNEQITMPYRLITCGASDPEITQDTCYDLRLEFNSFATWRGQRPEGWGYGDVVGDYFEAPLLATCFDGPDQANWVIKTIPTADL